MEAIVEAREVFEVGSERVGYVTAGELAGHYVSGPMPEDLGTPSAANDLFSFTWWTEPSWREELEAEFDLSQSEALALLHSWNVLWAPEKLGATEILFDNFGWRWAYGSGRQHNGSLELMMTGQAERSIDSGVAALRKIHSTRYAASLVRDLTNRDEQAFSSVDALLQWEPSMAEIVDLLDKKGLCLTVVPRKGVLVPAPDTGSPLEDGNLVDAIRQVADPVRTTRFGPRYKVIELNMEAGGLVAATGILGRTQFCLALSPGNGYRNAISGVNPWGRDAEFEVGTSSGLQ